MTADDPDLLTPRRALRVLEVDELGDDVEAGSSRSPSPTGRST